MVLRVEFEWIFSSKGKERQKKSVSVEGGSRNCRKPVVLTRTTPSLSSYSLNESEDRFLALVLSFTKVQGQCSSVLRGVVFTALSSLFSLYCMFSCVVALLNSDNT